MNNDLPLVSIVIPAYNYADYLDEAIQSVLDQDYSNIELIVLDDGSTDNTRDVLENYRGRFHWETHPNMGHASTLNKGWQMSKGQILAYLNADDVLLPHAVNTSVEHLMANPDVVLVYCDFNLIDPNSAVIRRVKAPEFNYRDMVVKLICPPGPGAFFLRSAFESAGLWDNSLRMILDYEYWLRLGLEGQFLRIPEVLALLRIHNRAKTFANADESMAEECVRVISAYYRLQRIPTDVRESREEALSTAHIVTARFHFRSGRYRATIENLRKAWYLHPRNFLSVRTWRLAVNALFSRIGHKIWWTVRNLIDPRRLLRRLP